MKSNQSQCVILLHGLARTHYSMHRMDQFLKSRGYFVCNINYPSRTLPIEKLACVAIENGLSCCRQHNAQSVHIVAHSLGGILVRYYTRSQKIPQLGRVVMLGPPNQGSEAVDRLKHLPGFGLINGPAGYQLGTGQDELPKLLGPVNFDCGVIAGRLSLNPFLSSLLPGQDDGKVSVTSARIDGIADFITLPVSHSFMMQDKETLLQTAHFLEAGRFDHSRPGHDQNDG